MSISQLKAAITIRRPPTMVFAELTDFRKWPRWQGGLARVEQVSAGPLQVGSQLRQTRASGNPRESLIEVTLLIPDRVLGLNSPSRPIAWHGTFTIEPVEDNCQLTLQFEIRATGLAGIFSDLIVRLTLKQELKMFKAMVETA